MSWGVLRLRGDTDFTYVSSIRYEVAFIFRCGRIFLLISGA